MMWLLIPLAIASGTLGRMGGAKGYHTLWRDLGCPAIMVLACWMLFGWHTWEYGALFLLSWGALSTYYDTLFGYDNMAFSGFVVGLAAFPLCFIDPVFVWLVALRTVILVVVWGCLNKYLPQRILIWRRDVAEEFCRYFVAL